MYDSNRKISSSESRKQSTDESSRIAAFNKYDYPLKFDSLPQKVLVLDLDETLIHCREKPFENVTTMTQLDLGSRKANLYVSERPGLRAFIDSMSRIYRLVLYTSAVKKYTELILETMEIKRYFARVLHREHCQLNDEGKLEKNLAILGEQVEHLILVDDSVVHMRNQPNNILLVKPYRGDSEDNELFYLAQFLEGLADEKDVRPVMERFERFPREKLQSTIQRIYTVHRYLDIKSLTSLKARYEPEFRISEKGVDSRFSDLETNLYDSDSEVKCSKMPFQKSVKSVFHRHFTDQAWTTADTLLNNDKDSDDSLEEWEDELTPEGTIVDKLPPMDLKPRIFAVTNGTARI